MKIVQRTLNDPLIRAVLRASGFPGAFFNRILGLGIDQPADRSWLEAQLEDYAAAGASYTISLCREAGTC